MLRTGNGLLSAIFGRIRGEFRSEVWMRQLKEYIGQIGLSFDMLRNMTKLGVNQVVDR